MDITNEDYVRDLIQDFESSQNRDHRIREIKAFEVYAGKLKEHVKNRVMQLYPKTYNSFSLADLNLTKKIVDKASKAYKQKPIRQLSGENESEAYSQLMSDIGATKAWQTFDTFYNLHRYACMWFSFINYVDENGEDQQKIILRPLNPFQFARTVDKDGSTREFIVNFPSSDLYETNDTDGQQSLIQDSQQDTSCKRYGIWSNNQHVMVKSITYKDNLTKEMKCRIEFEEIEGNPNNENQLGVIPAVFAQQGDNCALPITNPLSEQTVEFNQQYSVMLTGLALQTFGHLVLSHPEDQKMPDEIYNSLFTYSRLPQAGSDQPATTLDYLNPNPNIQSGLEVLSNYGHQIITEHLGDGSQKVQGSDNFTSGLDRMIAQSDITNLIESNQQVYADCEDHLYKIIKAFHEAKNDRTFVSENLTIKYPKAKPIQSEKEILEAIDKKLSLGLIQKWEALLMLDPNMSEADAREKIDVIKEEKQEEMNTMFSMGEDGDTDNEEN